MSGGDPIGRWRELQGKLEGTVGALPEERFRGHPHPDLSPPGWHLEHCVFVECLWIRSRLLGDDRIERDLAERSLPERTPKAERGERIPDPARLREWAAETMEGNVRLFLEVRAPDRGCEMLGHDRLLHFLISHHAQHLETVRAGCAWFERRGAADGAEAMHAPRAVLREAARSAGRRTAEVGGRRRGFSHDNELPRHRVGLPEARMAESPVSNAEWAGFVAAGGYEDPAWWSPAGERWRQGAGEGRARSRNGNGMDADAPVHGVNRHEAGAFARWAGGRLPHEHEWETAREEGLLGGTGQVWEWCANALYPYPGFRPFPYREYSVPWFDGGHFVLKGGSGLSEPEVRRPSFRNYFPAAMTALPLGLRLAFDGA